MSETINLLFPVLLNSFQGYCLQYFYGSFLESRLRDERWNGLAAAALYAAVKTVLAWTAQPGGWDHRSGIVKMVSSLLLLSVLAICFYKAFHLITVFLVTAFQAVADISRYAAVILLGELGDGMLNVWNWCAGKGMLTSERGFGIALYTGMIGGWLLEYLTIALLLYLPLRKIVQDLHEKEYDINRAELLFILTPAAVGLMLCMLLRIIMITMEDGVQRFLYDRYPVLIVLIPAILLLSLLSILQGVKLFQDMICWNRERSRRIVLEKQVADLQKHMKEMERVYSGIRSVKHDMKNTLSVIQRLSAGDSAEGDEELQAYLAELDRTFEKLEVRFKTGNTVVDILLDMKYHEAVRAVPDLKMDADDLLFPPDLKIKSYHIGVVLGNALDNGIEACRKLKEKEPGADVFIRLASFLKGDLLILRVENSFDGRIVKKRQDGSLETDKADKGPHGIGLANIKSTAEKYQGTMDLKTEGRVFVLSVMMKGEDGDGSWSDK